MNRSPCAWHHWLTDHVAHSIELLPDEATDSRIRHQWSALTGAGLTSAGQARAKTNRPHVTLVAAAKIAAAADTALLPAAGRLPLECTIGAPVVFGHGARHTLARLIVPNTELLSLHGQVSHLVTGLTSPDDPDAGGRRFGHVAPGAWTAHITLARRLTAVDVGIALQTLDGLGPTETSCTFVALRRWDSDARTEHILPSPAS